MARLPSIGTARRAPNGRPGPGTTHRLDMLYQQIAVWKRRGDRTAVKYSCLMSLATGKYSVQSADFHHLPLTDQALGNFDRQFVELFCEQDPAERAGSFDSLEEAIAAHDRTFA